MEVYLHVKEVKNFQMPLVSLIVCSIIIALFIVFISWSIIGNVELENLCSFIHISALTF